MSSPAEENLKHFLTYEAPWYQYGDADQPEFAILYGLIAIATMWIVESILHNLLFSSGDHISVAEVAALFTFKGASWSEIFRWNLRGRGIRRSRRAHIAILLRLVVTLVDIAIVVLAVPRDFPVKESFIGRPIITFDTQPPARKLLPKPSAIPFELHTCIWDKVQFRKFTPNAAIMVCFTSLSFEKPSPSGIRSNGFSVKYVSELERISFQSHPDDIEFFLTHNLFLPADSGRPASTYSLPLPADIVAQTSNMLARKLDGCNRFPGRTAGTDSFRCQNNNQTSGFELRKKVIIEMLNSTYTKRIFPEEIRKNRTKNLRKVRGQGNIDSSDQEIGTVNRPYLCVFPALIVFGALAIIDIMVKLWLGNNNIISKLYRLAVEAIGDDGSLNPLYANARTLIFQGGKFKDLDARGGYLSNWQSSIERLPSERLRDVESS